MCMHFALSGRWRAAWLTLLVVANPAARAQTSSSDLVGPSLVYLRVGLTPMRGPFLGVLLTDQATHNPLSRTPS